MKIIRPADQPRSTRGAFARRVGISRETAGASGLWVAWAEMGPGAVSAPHHHGASETAIFVLEGAARFFIGPDLAGVLDADAGDFVWVAPGEVHVEMNRSSAAPLRMIVSRSPDDVAVEMEFPAGWRPIV